MVGIMTSSMAMRGTKRAYDLTSQNPRSMRRLIADHAALHTQPLPQNFLFPPEATQADDLTQLDLLLAGPTHTPFSAGVWQLHFSIPSGYPDLPPTAHFRTPIFHPNVEPHTGVICVETLKRDWDNKLTLRDVLVTISCLLIQPNPDSALNAEAGALIQESYETYARRAAMMTGIHAKIPSTLQERVHEAQTRGHELANLDPTEPPARRRRTIAKVRAANTQRRRESSPPTRHDLARSTATIRPPFVLHSGDDDVFGAAPPRTLRNTRPALSPLIDEDTTMSHDDRENNTNDKPPTQPTTSKPSTPRRPNGTIVPLGELEFSPSPSPSPSLSPIPFQDPDTTLSDLDHDPEHPPSPRKSPRKTPSHHHQPLITSTSPTSTFPPPRLNPISTPIFAIPTRPESSRRAGARAQRSPHTHTRGALASGAAQITPPSDVFGWRSNAGEEDPTPSPKKARLFLRETREMRKEGVELEVEVEDSMVGWVGKGNVEDSMVGFGRDGVNVSGGSEDLVMSDVIEDSSGVEGGEVRLKREREESDARLWEACGRDVRRWNQGEFVGEPFARKAARW